MRVDSTILLVASPLLLGLLVVPCHAGTDAPGALSEPPGARLVTWSEVFPDVPACAVRETDLSSRHDPAIGSPEPLSRFPEDPVAWRRPGGPQEPPVGEQDLYTMQWSGLPVSSITAVTDDIPFVVRDDVVGITIRATVPGSDALVSVELVSPFGELIACLGCERAPAVGEVQVGHGTVQMPSTDRRGWELEPGEYAFRVRLLEPSAGGPNAPVDVLATFRTNAGVTVEHRLDLNFVYLPGSELSEQIATTDPHFAALLDTVNSYLEPTGIQLGEITHVDLDRPEFSVIATWEEAGAMFTTSRVHGRRRALNVYCVQAFEAPLNPVVGLSGGIPGPLRNGTVSSGIAIRTSPLFTCSNCLDAFGSLFAHEIGHYLGFYHTSEANLENWDPFSDTPECHNVGLGSCPDWFYVMFPVIHPVNTVWSPGQVTVAVTHPLVRTVPVIGGAPQHRSQAASGLRVPSASDLALSPNPFRESVRIEWSGRSPSGSAAIRIHDVRGRLVRLLPPSRSATWDGRDDAGRLVAPGTYFVRIRDGSDTRNGRVVRLP